MYGRDFLVESNKIGNAAFQINKRNEEKAEKDFVLKWAETIVGLEKGSQEYNEKVAELFADESMPMHKKKALFKEIDEYDTQQKHYLGLLRKYLQNIKVLSNFLTK